MLLSGRCEQQPSKARGHVNVQRLTSIYRFQVQRFCVMAFLLSDNMTAARESIITTTGESRA